MQIEMELVGMAREAAAYREGCEDEKRRQHHYAWGKLFALTVVGSTIGVLLAACLWAIIKAHIGV